jgi:hypothetical protein
MTVEHSTELTPRCKINNNLTLKFMDGVKKFAKDVKTISRRKSVIDRLEKQLKAGVKP